MAFTISLLAPQVPVFRVGRPGSFQPITASSVGISWRYQYKRRYSPKPSSMPAMSAFPSGPRCPVTINPPYIFARNARYELGSLNTMALVTVLFGATVGSVQPVPATPSRTAAPLTALVVRFMSFVPLEPDAQAGGDGARPRIEVVVDSVQARGRIHAAVARDRERGLDGGVQAERLSPVARGVAERDVIDPQERGVLHEIVR